MEAKKNKEADISRNTALYFNIGLAITLALINMAFAWKTEIKPVVVLGYEGGFEKMIEVVPTVQELKKPIPKVSIASVDVVEVKNDIPVDIEVDIVGIDETVDITPPVTLEKPAEEEAETVFLKVEKDPSPVGGIAAFYKYVGENLKYPSAARRMNIEGRIFVSFVVDKDGSLTNIEVLKGIGAGCDEEALRILANAPKWEPGKQRGKPVKVRMSLPIIFKLQ